MRGVTGMVKAVIMAGGEGTRLRPLTVNRPKPMVPLLNKPMMEHVVDLLHKYGVREIGVTLHYLPETIMRYFGEENEEGIRFYYSIEDKPLGTAGGVRNLVDQYGWNETLIIISGDVFTNLDLAKMLEYHKKKGSIFTMAIRRVDDPTKYGITLLDDDGRVLRFLEKPSWSEVFSDLINMGIYIIEPEAIKYIEHGKEFDFAKNLIPSLIRDEQPIYGWRADDYYWSDIGDIEQYKKAHWDILLGKARPPKPIKAQTVRDGIYIGKDAIIDKDVRIIPPVIIGPETRISSGSTIGPFIVIGSNCIVEQKAVIEKSIVWNRTYIGYSSRIVDSVIGEGVKLEEHVVVHEGAVIGDETIIGRGSQVKPRIKIWPSKIIDPYTVVSINVKWGIRWYKTLIEPWGITGLVNIEISPELATRIGLALASTVPMGETIVLARDTYSTSRMVKHGVAAGLLSGGVNVDDLGVAPLPVLTYYIRKHGFAGGVMITSIAYDPQRIRIKIFNRNGKFIDQTTAKKIENIFFKEAFRKVLGDTVGMISLPRGHLEEYVEAILRHVSIDNIMKKDKILVECEYGAGGVVWGILSQKLPISVYHVNCNATGSARPRREVNIQRNIDSVTKIVPLLRLNAGFIFDSDADKLSLVTENGEIVSGDRVVALVLKILLETRGPGKVVLPHNSSSIVEAIARQYGAEIIYAGQGLLGLSQYLNNNVLVAADERGGIIYPWIHYGPDAIYTALLILDYLGRTGQTLSTLLREIPQPAVIRRTIMVPYNLRGRFMRLMYEELKEKEIDTLDGIKIIEEDLGWGYIRPLPNEPLIEIIAESDTMARAEKLVKTLLMLAQKVKSML